jgi:uncharacterized SAM-dependent methyltransferase
MGIINDHAGGIAARTGMPNLFEIDSVFLQKSCALLDILHCEGQLTYHMAVDISSEALEQIAMDKYQVTEVELK